MTDKHGSVGWVDLTVDDAEGLRDFYASILPWQAQKHDMGDYDDYVMVAPNGESKAGVCHRRGSNAKMPAQWMLYFVVAECGGCSREGRGRRRRADRAPRRGRGLLRDHQRPRRRGLRAVSAKLT